MTVGKQKSESVSIELLWIDVGHLPRAVQFLLHCILVFVFYLLYGYLQEYIFAMEGFKPYGWYLTLVQFLYYSIFGFVEMKCRSCQRKIPWSLYYVLALITVGTIGFSNSSLKYLNYPTQVIFKCCKLIPVMIGGILIQKKKYNIIDYLASCCMSLGLIAFCLADSQLSPNFHMLGVLMISCALTCDAIIGNTQEKAMKKYSASNCEIIFYSYLIGFFYILFGIFLDGDLFRGAEFCFEYPQIYVHAFFFSISGYLGVQVVLSLVRTYGALTAVTVTTCRKVVSIVISFIFFEKPFSIHYLWAGLLIIAGIYLNVFGKNKVHIARSLNSLLRRKKEKTILDVV